MFQLRLTGVRVSADLHRGDERQMPALFSSVVMTTKVGIQTTSREPLSCGLAGSQPAAG
jgi:hypothetical protein